MPVDRTVWRVITGELEFYATPGPMTWLPRHPALDDIPAESEALRGCVQGVLVHRDWVAEYGLSAEQVRLDEQYLRTTAEVLGRTLEICPEPITAAREPTDRVVSICRDFALVHTALLRAHGVPARVRCGFANYFDRAKWYDHWITERWNGRRWIREDPQIDEIQAKIIDVDFDPYDQPPGQFLAAGEAWTAVRAGELDADLFGIFDMWGLPFIAGNVLADIACLNKVELLPWDGWGMGLGWGPHDQLADQIAATIDDLAALTAPVDFDAVRERYTTDDAVRVPAVITSFVDGRPTAVHLDL